MVALWSHLAARKSQHTLHQCCWELCAVMLGVLGTLNKENGISTCILIVLFGLIMGAPAGGRKGVHVSFALFKPDISVLWLRRNDWCARRANSCSSRTYCSCLSYHDSSLQCVVYVVAAIRVIDLWLQSVITKCLWLLLILGLTV